MGTPGELYHKPRTAFVADFIGQTNLLPATVLEQAGPTVRLRTPVGDFSAAGQSAAAGQVKISIRPEQMRIVKGDAPANGRNRLTGTTLESTFLGEASEHVLLVNGQRIRVISAPPIFDVPEQLIVEFDPEDVVVLPE